MRDASQTAQNETW